MNNPTYKIGLDTSPYCKFTPKNFSKRLNKESAYICDSCKTGHYAECDESNFLNSQELREAYETGRETL